MAFFDVGDVVHIRTDLSERNPNPHGNPRLWWMDGYTKYDTVVSSMLDYAGTEAVIEHVYATGYTIQDGHGWQFTDDMIDEYIYRDKEFEVDDDDEDLAMLFG